MKRAELEALIARLRKRKGADAQAAAAWMERALWSVTRGQQALHEYQAEADAGKIPHDHASARGFGSAWAIFNGIIPDPQGSPWERSRARKEG
jgi:hypothetical protein